MFTRRDFLKNSVLLGSAAMFLPACSSAPKPRKIGANEKLNVAVVGCGGRGFSTVRAVGMLATNANLVALCDVDDVSAAKAYKTFPSVPRFRDYRVMLSKMGRDIDAVAVCTPDHMHYPIAAWAIANGKHVFCEKPLTRTIWEARELKRLADEAGVVTQMGNQGHTFDGWKDLREWVEAGILGEIEEICMWTNRPTWPQGADLKRPVAGGKIPETLSYDLWLGVAPYQPYSKSVVPFNWRGVRNFGTGAAGDMACHFFDTPYSGLGLGFPTSFTVKSSPFSDYSYPLKTSMVMNFDNKFGKNGKIKLRWFDGKQRPEHVKGVSEEFLKDPRNQNCLFVVGSKATFTGTHYGTESRLTSRELMIELKKSGAFPAKKYARSKHKGMPQLGWIDSCIDGTESESNFGYACPFTEMVLLSMVGALVPDRELKYNPATMSFDSCPEAERLVSSLYDYNPSFLP